MKCYLLGIDLGTSSVRAGIFREDGERAAIAARTYPIKTPSPGWAEQNPEDWWNKTCECIKEALNSAHLTGNDIKGISFSAQTHGVVLLDRDGNHLVPAIIWADARSSDEIPELEEIIGEKRLEKVIMNRIFPGTQAATIRWMQKHAKDVWKNTRRILLPKDYLRYRMCGLFNTEPSDASCTLLFDSRVREWSQDILDVLEIPREYMPYVVNSDQYIGETENMEDAAGIPDGVPVIMGGSDQPCAALGNGIIDEGAMLVTIGTGRQIFAPTESPITSPELCLNTFCHLPETRWYVMGATLSAGLSLRWFRDTFCPGTDFDTLASEAADVTPCAEGLLFVPYLAGKRSPDLNPSAAGEFAGIKLTHTRGHFVRAVMEGVAFDLRENLDVMTGMGLEPETMICSGGAANSPLWLQITADIFNRPLMISAQDEQACFGAALTAGIGTEVYKNYYEAVEIVKKPEKTVEPLEENKGKYEKQFEKFKKIYRDSIG